MRERGKYIHFGKGKKEEIESREGNEDSADLKKLK